jgi:hypothetical protein
MSHVQHKIVHFGLPLNQLLAFLFKTHLIFGLVQLFLEQHVGHLAQAREQLVLLLTVPFIHEVVDPSLAHFAVASVLLPGLNNLPQVEVISRLSVELIHQTFLCLRFLIKVSDVVFLVGDRLHHFRYFVIASA